MKPIRFFFERNHSGILGRNILPCSIYNATWQYISANNSLVISFKEQSYMLHPSFKDDVIFALQLDGTEADKNKAWKL